MTQKKRGNAEICLSIHRNTRPSTHLSVLPLICPSFHLSVRPFTHLSVLPLICPFFIHLSALPVKGFHLSIRPSTHLSVLTRYLSVFPIICPPLHLSVRLSTHLSVFPFIISYVRLSTHLSVPSFICPFSHSLGQEKGQAACERCYVMLLACTTGVICHTARNFVFFCVM